jgi:uroporphyrinogen-III synthase
MTKESQPGLDGLRVVSFESRRAAEIAELIRRHGGDPIVAPSLREIPLSDNPAAVEFVDRLERGEVDLVILLTGVGTRALVEAVSSRSPREDFVRLLSRVPLIARGPKPVAALKQLGLRPAIAVPEPNTWKELLAAVDGELDLRGKRVAVQEYGATNDDLLAALSARGAQVVRVPVYRWALPEDTGPLRAAIGEIVQGRVDVALFTNATQVEHLFQVAGSEGVDRDLEPALRQIVVGSIGPICTEALRRFRLDADIEPRHPKMGHLITALSEHARGALAKKRQRP